MATSLCARKVSDMLYPVRSSTIRGWKTGPALLSYIRIDQNFSD